MWRREQEAFESVDTAEMQEEQALEVYGPHFLHYIVCQRGKGE